MAQFVSKYMYDISLWNFFKAGKTSTSCSPGGGWKGTLTSSSTGFLFHSTYFSVVSFIFFLQQGPQISSTSNKVMLSVPNGEGALPLLLDCRPFSYLRASLLEPPGDKNMPERCQPVATHQSVAPAVPGEACVFAGMNGSHKQQLAGPYVRAVCMRPC